MCGDGNVSGWTCDEGPTDDVCSDHRLGLAPNVTRADGLLTGTPQARLDIPGTRPAAGVFGGHVSGRDRAALAVATVGGATPDRLSAAWPIPRPGVTSPITRATTPDHVVTIVGGVNPARHTIAGRDRVGR